VARVMKVKVEINTPLLQAELEHMPGALRSLVQTGVAVEESVVALAPYGVSLSWPWRRPMRHGWFKESINLTQFRTWVRVYSDDPFAHLVEWGSAKNPAYAPFRRTLRRFEGTVNPEKHHGDPWNKPASPAIGVKR
jgi:hypothetical protein